MISSLSECQIAEVSVGVQITVREFENTEGYEIRAWFNIRVVCTFVTTKKKKKKHKTRDWFSDVVCLWYPRNDSSLLR